MDQTNWSYALDLLKGQDHTDRERMRLSTLGLFLVHLIDSDRLELHVSFAGYLRNLDCPLDEHHETILVDDLDVAVATLLEGESMHDLLDANMVEDVRSELLRLVLP